MIELDDGRSLAEIWHDLIVLGNAASVRLRSLDSNDLMCELTCFVCCRRWVGGHQELVDYLEVHRHDPVAELRWHLATLKGWPRELEVLLQALLITLEEFDDVLGAVERFREIRDRLEGLEAEHGEVLTDEI